MGKLDEFVERIHDLFPNFLELITKCDKEIYITSMTQLQLQISNFEKATEYYEYFDYDSLKIFFFPWRKPELLSSLFIPYFLKKLEVRVSQKEEVVFGNLFFNDIYVGNIYFIPGEKISQIVFKDINDPNILPLIQSDKVDDFADFVHNLIIVSFAYVYDNPSVSTIYNAIDFMLLKNPI